MILTPDAAPTIDALFGEMESQLREGLDEGTGVTFHRSMDAHLAGQSWETPFVPVPDGTIDADAITTIVQSFHDTYENRSGNRFEAMPVEGVTFRVRAVLDTPKVDYPEAPQRGDEPLAPVRTTVLRYLGDIDADGEAHSRPASTTAKPCAPEIF